ncbi:MAG: sodium/glutamate symporter [Gammaproteobacteria bacterium]
MELAMAVATFGLVLGGIIGGPVAGRLIKKHEIQLPRKTPGKHGIVLQHDDSSNTPVDEDNFLLAFFYVLLCIILGKLIAAWFDANVMTLPDIVWCMFVGVVIGNITLHDSLPKAHQPSIDLIGNIALSLFLVMALMSLNLWGMLSMAGPLLILLGTQLSRYSAVCQLHNLANHGQGLQCSGHCRWTLRIRPGRHTYGSRQHERTDQTLLSACSRGPDNDSLRTEIQQRLDQQFSENLFQIRNLIRKGSAPRLDGVDGIYVYYNLELEFLRDYHLTTWRNLNVGTLAVVLGASTTSIEGFNSAGNSKGDRLLVRGRLGYQQTDDTWVVNPFRPLQFEETTTVAETLDTPSPKAIISTIRELLNCHTDANRSEHDQITLRELRRSLSRIDLGHADLDQYHTFGTGWPGGAYYKFGEAFAAYANNIFGFLTMHPKAAWKMESG